MQSDLMNRFLLLTIILIVGSLLASIPLFSQLANAGSAKKIQFTQTLTSTQDPGQGHSNEQMVVLLPPNSGSIYHGSLTYSSSQPIQVVILHQIDKSESKGQSTWTVDGNTIYAQTVIDLGSGGSVDFTGSALGLRSTNSSQFTVTVSIDGWVRAMNPQAIQKINPIITGNYTLKLPNTTIPIKIPLHEGLVNGKTVYYIITDSSNILVANQISDKQNWHVNLSPQLARVPSTSYNNIYIFSNGIEGNGTRGFQDDVLSFTPSDKQSSPLSRVVQATWNIGRNAIFLNSTQAILDANMTGKIKLTITDTIINNPQVAWGNDGLGVRDNRVLSDQTSYVGGQVLDVNTSNMTVTLVGHRGWGPDGKTMYYVVLAATPEGPSQSMKIQYVPILSSLEPLARDLYQFGNGFKGAGPFGYQEGITDAQPGDPTYIPICKVSMVTWKDPQNAKILENINDVNSETSSGTITVQTASVFNQDYVLDCPIVTNP